MTRWLLVWLMLSVAGIAAEPKPILVAQVFGPLRIDAHDSPTLALYEDGTLIYLHDERTAVDPFYRRNVPDAALLAKEIIPFDMAKFPGPYSTASATCQIYTVLWTTTHRIIVEGDWQRILKWKRDPKRDEWNQWDREHAAADAKEWESLPNEIQRALVKLDEQCQMKGEPWLPATIEVVVTPYTTEGEGVPWPAEWPGLHAKETRQGQGRSRIIPFPVRALPAVRRFLSSLKGNAPALFEGEKMLPYYRYPLPQEKNWWDGKEPY